MEKVLVLDFGGQYNQLIARRVRDLHVFSEILPYQTSLSDIEKEHYKGIILTGGPRSVNETDAPLCEEALFQLGIPVLGICYGAQLMAKVLKGKVRKSERREYGRTEVTAVPSSRLFKGVSEKAAYFMSHTDQIADIPRGFTLTAWSESCPCAAMESPRRRLYGVQFHPEVTHTEYGMQILSNFLFDICGCAGDWQMDDFIERSIEKIRKRVGDQEVLLGLSGGVDSAVAAALLDRAVGERLTCVFVDTGLLRKGEAEQVEKVCGELLGGNLVRIDAKDRFYSALKGITDPEEKRRRIGETFYEVFWNEIREHAGRSYFAQGTIYPDRVESGLGHAAKIKTHHNQVEMPEDIHFEGILEPLQDLFKDEVRKVGAKLGLPENMVNRQPFPGPGLGVRIIGEVTAERVRLLQEADWILQEEIQKAGYAKELSQYFAILPGVKTVGVMGDERTYSELLALRAVVTDDFMTAEWARIPHELLGRIANRIIGEVPGINRVVYDITSKPPGTLEWE